MQVTTTVSPSHINKNRLNLLLDIGLLLMFLVVYEPRASGITVHEWLGVVMGSVLLVHILLHWDWLSAITRTFCGKLTVRARLSYVVSAGVFVGFVSVLFSGLMMSERVLPFFGLAGSDARFWHALHGLSADITLWLVALHIALRWRWVVTMVQRYGITPLAGKHPQPMALGAARGQAQALRNEGEHPQGGPA